MDLVATVRKQGSRGGVNFNWEDVATSSRREHYLGHSLKAPVGRWQHGRDLTWYAKDKDGDGGDGEVGLENKGDDEDTAVKARRDELRRVKEAEEQAMALALGFPPGTSLGGGAGSSSGAVAGAASTAQ
ncbi:hypothetical protein SEPCBS57363_004901 [Sporothrix epigloea]|uniref:Multiple myeloma tumor-associated protein 2-like N-terminal domain-containing protein n=1 Tax=Sporothrix epigloea TaxID=1892477 RepID=A0ABP0DUR4_9PEZI